MEMRFFLLIFAFFTLTLAGSEEEAGSNWKSLNNRGFERKPKSRERQTTSESRRQEEEVTRYGQKIDKFPKVLYGSGEEDTFPSGTSPIRDDADIGFDHEEDAELTKKITSSLYNDALRGLDIGHVPTSDLANGLVSDNKPGNNDYIVPVIPSLPLLDTLDKNNNNYVNLPSSNNNNGRELRSNDQTTTEIPPLPLAATRTPRKVRRGRKQYRRGGGGSSDQIKVTVNAGSSSVSYDPVRNGPRVESKFSYGSYRPDSVNSNSYKFQQIKDNYDNIESFQTPSPSQNAYHGNTENNDNYINNNNNNNNNNYGSVGNDVGYKKPTRYYDDSDKWDVNPFGQPGIDFPAFSSPPLTGFKCSAQKYPGFYADPGSYCQAFYICQADGREDAFLCPNGTLFNQQYFICDWYYNVDCSQARNYYSLNAFLYITPNNKRYSESTGNEGVTTSGGRYESFDRVHDSIGYDRLPQGGGDFGRPSNSKRYDPDVPFPLQGSRRQKDGDKSYRVQPKQGRQVTGQSKSNVNRTRDDNRSNVSYDQTRENTSQDRYENADDRRDDRFGDNKKPKNRGATNWWTSDDLSKSMKPQARKDGRKSSSSSSSSFSGKDDRPVIPQYGAKI